MKLLEVLEETPVQRRLLMRVLSVTQILRFFERDVQSLGQLDLPLSLFPLCPHPLGVQVARDHRAKILFLEVRPTNEAGQRLYGGYGFRQIGVRRGYYPAHKGRQDALVLALDL